MRTKKRATPEEARAVALDLFSRRDRPIMVGQLALELPYYSLDDAEAVFLSLEASGVIRKITDAEKREYGVTYGFLLR